MAQTTEATGHAARNRRRCGFPACFHAPRETVFKAWSSAEHVKHWFSPETYTVPDADGGDAGRRPVRRLHALSGRRGALDPRQVRRSRRRTPGW